MFFKSIRFKIVIWYMLILTLTLLVFSQVLYRLYYHSLYENIDDLLRTRAEGVVTSVNTYWDTEKLEITKDGSQQKVFSKINNINFEKMAQLWVTEKSNDPELLSIIVQILNIKGRTIASSKNLPEFLKQKKNIQELLSSGQSHYGDFTIVLPEGRNKTLALRAFITPVREQDKIAYLVLVASPTTQLAASISRLKTILWLLLPLTVILTGVAGGFLAKKSLRPVDEMIDTIRQLTAENLKQKITVPQSNDEIQRLAETFNAMLQRLAEYFTAQQHFIQDLSHEFRTPLTILKGELEVTLKRLRSPEEYALVLASSLEEIDHLSRIIENLLILARLDNQEVQMNLEPVSLSALIKEVFQEISILARQKYIELIFDPAAEIIVRADRSQLKRVVLNLLDNAIKYTPVKGQVSIQQELQGTRILIKIQDNGPGIPTHELNHIFDRFYRADKSRNKIGFGLGLSIAKSIIEAHQGSISAQSQEDQGATFIIDLPNH